VLWLQLGLLVELLSEDLLARPAAVMEALRRLLH
jgi:hypothetical protein